MRFILVMPVVFYEQGDVERTRLAGHMTRFKMAEDFCTIFSLKNQKIKFLNGVNLLKAQRKILHGIYFVIEILKKMQQIFDCDFN